MTPTPKSFERPSKSFDGPVVSGGQARALACRGYRLWTITSGGGGGKLYTEVCYSTDKSPYVSSPTDSLCQRLSTLLHPSCQAKVADGQVAVGVKHEVRRLQVPVEHVRAVDVLETSEQLHTTNKQKRVVVIVVGHYFGWMMALGREHE